MLFSVRNVTKRAKSTARCGHFGTHDCSELPIAFENGPMEDGTLIWISAKERCIHIAIVFFNGSEILDVCVFFCPGPKFADFEADSCF